MNTKHILGWIVVVAGLVIIGQTINASYRFFTAKAEFPAVFKAPAAQSAVTEIKPNAAPASQAEAQAQAQQAISQATSQAISNIIPADLISKLMNTIVWSIFATFLVYAGAKIAEIGIKLIA